VRFNKMPFLLARTLDDTLSDEARSETQRLFFSMRKCCLGFTGADLRERLTVDCVSGLGRWSPFWERTLWAWYDSMDLSTADVEGAHAAHSKLLVGSCGGGSGFTSFAAKATNRQSAAQYEAGVQRNRSADELRALRFAAPEVRKPRGGGSSSGKHLLHSEVCRHMKCQVINKDAREETTRRWSELTDHEKESYNHRAKALRISRLAASAIPQERDAPAPLPPPPALARDGP
jgi:hypothetical protein